MEKINSKSFGKLSKTTMVKSNDIENNRNNISCKIYNNYNKHRNHKYSLICLKKNNKFFNLNDNIKVIKTQRNNYGRYYQFNNKQMNKFFTNNVFDDTSKTDNSNNNKMTSRYSKSSEIVKLCRTYKNLNTKKIVKKENNRSCIMTFYKKKIDKRKIKYKDKYYIKRVIIIQKWWKNILYNKYLKKPIMIIQRLYRGYCFRKKFRMNILNKIIFLQKFWKNLLKKPKEHKIIINKNRYINVIIKKDELPYCFFSKKNCIISKSLRDKIYLIQKFAKKFLSLKKNLFPTNNSNNNTFSQVYHKKIFLYKNKYCKNICLVKKSNETLTVLNYSSKNSNNNTLMKQIFKFKSNINTFNYISKNRKILSTTKHNQIIFLQRKLKLYLDIKNFKIGKKKNSIISCKRYDSTSDVSEEKNNTLKKKLEKISEFKLYEINDSTKNKLETNFISNNLNSFSFELKTKEKNKSDENLPLHSSSSRNKKNKMNRNIKNIINLSAQKYFQTNNDIYPFIALKNLLISTISTKLSSFLITLLKRVKLLKFIYILKQKITKNINQFTYPILFNAGKIDKKELFVFKTLRRHILYNLNIKDSNEIKRLLVKNFPKCFDNKSINISYINRCQENNLINGHLFINDNNALINYFIGFFKQEQDKYYNFNIDFLSVKNIFNNNKIKNRNIYALTRYMDNVFIYLLNVHKINKYNKMKIKKFLVNKFNKSIEYYKNKITFNKEQFFEVDEKIDFEQNYQNIYTHRDVTDNSFPDFIYDENNNNNNILNQSTYKFIDFLNGKKQNKF